MTLEREARGAVGLVPITFCVLAVMQVAGAACTATTSGTPVQFEVQAVGVADGGDPKIMDTLTGWHVVLDAAYVSLGAIWAYAPEVASFDPLRELLVPVARAHGGHEHGGGRDVRGELLEQVTFDALSRDPVSLGIMDGTAGPASDLTIELEPEAAPSSALAGATFRVSGVATRGDERVEFEGSMDLPPGSSARMVEGIPLDCDFSAEGHLLIEVRPSSWLDGVDFAQLSGAEGRASIEPDTQPAIAWRLGVRSERAIAARWENDR